MKSEIQDDLKTVFNRHNLLEKFRKQKPLLVWDKVAGGMKNFTRPKLVKGKKLIVEVSSPSVKQELAYLEEDYVREINKRLEKDSIEEIEFSVSSIAANIEEKQKDAQIELENEKLSDKEKKKIRDLLSNLDLKGELKESLESLITAKLKADKIRLRNGWNKCYKCGRVHRGEECPGCKYSGGDESFVDM